MALPKLLKRHPKVHRLQYLTEYNTRSQRVPWLQRDVCEVLLEAKDIAAELLHAQAIYGLNRTDIVADQAAHERIQAVKDVPAHACEQSTTFVSKHRGYLAFSPKLPNNHFHF
jgi:hypothetical protein